MGQANLSVIRQSRVLSSDDITGSVEVVNAFHDLTQRISGFSEHEDLQFRGGVMLRSRFVEGYGEDIGKGLNVIEDEA